MAILGWYVDCISNRTRHLGICTTFQLHHALGRSMNLALSQMLEHMSDLGKSVSHPQMNLEIDYLVCFMNCSDKEIHVPQGIPIIILKADLKWEDFSSDNDINWDYQVLKDVKLYQQPTQPNKSADILKFPTKDE